MDYDAMVMALEDLIGTMQSNLDALKANPALAQDESWIEDVENEAHWGTDFSSYADNFKA